MRRRSLGLPALLSTGAAGLLLVAACSSSSGSSSSGSTASHPATSSAGKAATIAFLMPCSTCAARFEHQDQPDFISAVHTLDPGAKVIADNAQGSDATQISQAEDALTNGATVLVVSPLDQTTGEAIAAKAKAAHATVISYDGLLTGAQVSFYVSFDPVVVGTMQGQYLVSHLAKGSTVVMINGDQTVETGREFKQGALNALQPAFRSGQLKLGYSADTTQFDPSKAQAEMAAALTRLHNNVQGVLVANDGMAAGVIAELKAQHLAGRVLVTGQDATDAGLGDILEGIQSMTVYKSIRQEADTAAKVAVGLATGNAGIVQSVATSNVSNGAGQIPSLLLSPQVITKLNVSLAVSDGASTWSAICAGIPAGDCPGH
jgi:D-xylose transport system substrate-binding protein